jgi:hypothetical protein
MIRQRIRAIRRCSWQQQDVELRLQKRYICKETGVESGRCCHTSLGPAVRGLIDELKTHRVFWYSHFEHAAALTVAAPV